MHIEYDNRSLEERGVRVSTERHFKISPAKGEDLEDCGEFRDFPTYLQDGSLGARRRIYRYPQRQTAFKEDVIPVVSDWVPGQHPKPNVYNLEALKDAEEIWILANEIEVWQAWQEGIQAVCFFTTRPTLDAVSEIVNEVKDSACETINVLLSNSAAGRRASIDVFDLCQTLRIRCNVYDLSLTAKDNSSAEFVYETRSITPDKTYAEILTAQQRVGGGGIEAWRSNAANSEEQEEIEHSQLLQNLGLASRKCPVCGEKAVIVNSFNGGYKCWKKRNGCGKLFPVGAKEIESQKVSVANKDISDFLLEVVSADELFHTDDGGRYICVKRGDKKSTYPILGKEFEDWLVSQYYDFTQKTIKKDQVATALMTLAARAKTKGQERKSNVRTAWFNQCIYIDLCNEEEQVVRVSEEGWEVVSCPKGLFFLRTLGMLPMPTPVYHPRGSMEGWESFRRIINIGVENNWVMITAWMVAAMIPPGPPCPILRLSGEQGTGKSTLTRWARNTIDPNIAYSVKKPKDDTDVIISAMTSRVLCIDNLSQIERSLSDTLAALVTGAPSKTRKFFTNSEEVIYTGQPAMILNGIPDDMGGTDLNDRALKVVLPVIAGNDNGYETIGELDDIWESNRPYLLASILDALVLYIRNKPIAKDMTKTLTLPRMADFTRALVSCQDAMPYPNEAFYGGYIRNIQESSEAENEALFPQAVISYVNDRALQSFDIAAKALLHDLNSEAAALEVSQEDLEEIESTYAGDFTRIHRERKILLEQAGAKIQRDKGWPRDVKAMQEMLSRCAPNLRKSARIDVRKVGGSGYTIVLMDMPVEAQPELGLEI